MKIYLAKYLIPGAAPVAKYFKNERLANKWLEPCVAAAKVLGMDIGPTVSEIEVSENE
jgi:hypothetical protein